MEGLGNISKKKPVRAAASRAGVVGGSQGRCLPAYPVEEGEQRGTKRVDVLHGSPSSSLPAVKQLSCGEPFFSPTSQNSTRQPLSTGSDVLTFVPSKHPLHHPFCSVHGAGRAAHLEMEPGKPLEERDTSSGLTF